MRLIIERDAALKALARVQGVAKSKPTIPITANVKIEAGAAEVVFTTNNLDQQAVASAKASVEAPGVITVEARRLYDIVRAFPEGGQVLLSYKDDGVRLTAQCGSARYQIPTLPADTFPQFSNQEQAAGGPMERDAFRRIVQRAQFAMSTEETRYLLNGLHLHVATLDERLCLIAAATDKLALAQVFCPATDAFDDFPPVTLPYASVGEILRFLSDAPETIELYASVSVLEIRTDAAELATKTIDGVYPDYVRVIPVTNPVRLALDVDLMQASINRILLVADGKARTVRVTLSAEQLQLSARSEDLTGGEVHDAVSITYAGPACEFGLNAKRVKDVLSLIQGENAIFAFSEDPTANPVLVTDSADPDCRYVLTQHRA